MQVRVVADNAGSRFSHAACDAQRIMRCYLRRCEPEERVGRTHRLLKDRRIAVLTSDNLCTTACQISNFFRVSRNQRDVGFSIEEYVCEFVSNVAGRSGDYNLHDFSPSSRRCAGSDSRFTKGAPYLRMVLVLKPRQG